MKNYFHGYKHVVHIDANKINWNMGHWYEGPFFDDVRLHCATYSIQRVLWDGPNGWVMNEMGGYDEVFVATDYDHIATYFALKWS